MKRVDIFSYNGDKVIPTAGLAEIMEKDRRTVTCKVKGNAELFAPGEAVLLEGRDFEAFKRENGIYGNALGSGKCRVFSREGARKVLGLFCKGGTAIDWETGEVLEARKVAQRAREGISVEGEAEFFAALTALGGEVRALLASDDAFERKCRRHQARDMARAILEYVDSLAED